jgi:hypothetical protein
MGERSARAGVLRGVMGAIVMIVTAGGLAGCGDDPVVSPPTGPSGIYAGTLAVDIRGKAVVRIEPRGGERIQVTLRFEDVNTLGLFDPATMVDIEGRREVFPETGAELFTAKIMLPAHPSGPCGGEPVAAALSLHRARGNVRFAGALTAYCGDRFFGVPAGMLRLTGDLGRE